MYPKSEYLISSKLVYAQVLVNIGISRALSRRNNLFRKAFRFFEALLHNCFSISQRDFSRQPCQCRTGPIWHRLLGNILQTVDLDSSVTSLVYAWGFSTRSIDWYNHADPVVRKQWSHFTVSSHSNQNQSFHNTRFWSQWNRSEIVYKAIGLRPTTPCYTTDILNCLMLCLFPIF